MPESENLDTGYKVYVLVSHNPRSPIGAAQVGFVIVAPPLKGEGDLLTIENLLIPLQQVAQKI